MYNPILLLQAIVAGTGLIIVMMPIILQGKRSLLRIYLIFIMVSYLIAAFLTGNYNGIIHSQSACLLIEITNIFLWIGLGITQTIICVIKLRKILLLGKNNWHYRIWLLLSIAQILIGIILFYNLVKHMTRPL
jgi:hypothetical protein